MCVSENGLAEVYLKRYMFVIVLQYLAAEGRNSALLGPMDCASGT